MHSLIQGQVYRQANHTWCTNHPSDRTMLLSEHLHMVSLPIAAVGIPAEVCASSLLQLQQARTTIRERTMSEQGVVIIHAA